VFNIAFVGDHKVGKSNLIAALNSKKFNSDISQTEEIQITTTDIAFPSGDSKIIIMTEIPPLELINLNTDPNVKNYDLICVCFDNHNHLINFFRENNDYLPKYVPKIGIHCKNDSDEFEIFEQGEEIETELSETFGLREIVECSSKNEELRDVLSGIMKMIKNP
jgi:GTPase SAR1 family protein